MKEIFTGKTVEEAKIAAVTAFGADAGEITFEILEEPTKSIFGKIKGEAKIEASYTPPSVPAPPLNPVDSAEENPVVNTETKLDKAVNYVVRIVEAYTENASYTETKVEDGVVLDFSDELIIGKNGEVIDAIQYLATMLVNKGEKDYVRLVVDSNGYRQKRLNELIALADKSAASVLKKGRAVALAAMNPYERRIVHARVSENPGVYSKSIGEDPDRKIIVYPKRKELDYRNLRQSSGGKGSGSTGDRNRDFRDKSPDQDSQAGKDRDQRSKSAVPSRTGDGNRRRNDRPGDRGRNDRRDSRRPAGPPKALDLSTSFENEYKRSLDINREKIDDNSEMGLYGIIEL